MSNHRITTTMAVLATAVVAGAPSAYGGSSLKAAVHLEAHANADTGAAKHALRSSAARARVLMARGSRELGRAAAIVHQADAQAATSGGGGDHAVLAAQASLSSSAASQSATLQSIVDRATGAVAAAARRAKARADAIRSDADTALTGSGGAPGDLNVSAGAEAGTGGSGASADGSGTGSTGGIELLGMLSGGAR
jgi:hypothetical protein